MKPVFDEVGFFEEIWDATTRKCIGTRTVKAQPGRECGMAGDQEFTITSSLCIRRGHKLYVIKASPAKPVKLFSRLLIICGRVNYNHPLSPQ